MPGFGKIQRKTGDNLTIQVVKLIRKLEQLEAKDG